jgi:hypothetical protein
VLAPLLVFDFVVAGVGDVDAVGFDNDDDDDDGCGADFDDGIGVSYIICFEGKIVNGYEKNKAIKQKNNKIHKLTDSSIIFRNIVKGGPSSSTTAVTISEQAKHHNNRKPKTNYSNNNNKRRCEPIVINMPVVTGNNVNGAVLNTVFAKPPGGLCVSATTLAVPPVSFAPKLTLNGGSVIVSFRVIDCSSLPASLNNKKPVMVCLFFRQVINQYTTHTKKEARQ